MSGFTISLEDGQLFVGDASGNTLSKGIVKRASARSVEDEDGAKFELKGDLVQQHCAAVSSDTLDKFAEGFPKSWKRLVQQEARYAETVQRMKDVTWRNLPFVGIEFDAIPEIYANQWEFPHLTRELQSGKLNDLDHPVYLFLAAQPVYMGGVGADTQMLAVPYIVAIDCAVPPPDQLVYHSVQLSEHKVIDMRSLPNYARYQWEPLIPYRVSRSLGVDRSPPAQVYILNWAGRKSQFANLKEENVHYIEFLHPYMLLPQEVDKLEPAPVTTVDFTFTFEEKEYPIVFDKEIDRLATYIPDFIETNELTGKVEFEDVKAELVNAFKTKRAAEAAKHEQITSQVDQLSAQENAALRAIKTYKFYPAHPSLDVAGFVDSSINTYFGAATEVMLPSEEDVEDVKEQYGEDEEEEQFAKRSKK